MLWYVFVVMFIIFALLALREGWTMASRQKKDGAAN